MNLGRIYKLTSPLTDKIYIGSTESKLNRRLSEHKAQYKLYLKGEGSNLTSFQIIKFAQYRIELIEDFTFKNKIELLRREKFHIRNNKNTVNKNIPSRTVKEYHQENQYKIKEYQKSYYEFPIKCNSCNCSFTKYNLSRHKKSQKHLNKLQSQ